jgi:hypothetical protein
MRHAGCHTPTDPPCLLACLCTGRPAGGRFAWSPRDRESKCRRCESACLLEHVQSALASNLACRSRSMQHLLVQCSFLHGTICSRCTKVLVLLVLCEIDTKAYTVPSYSLLNKPLSLARLSANGRACNGPNQSQKNENESKVTNSTPVDARFASE